MTDLRRVPLTIGVLLLLATAQQAAAQTINAPRCGTGVHEEEAKGTIGFPQDQIFCPLLADPKEPRSFVSWPSEASHHRAPTSMRPDRATDRSSASSAR